MENPARLVRRAALNKRQKAAVQIPLQPAPAAPPSPRHTSSHASYTALMRSHDRVSTRHIPPGRGA